jgi:hypothetical protein
VRNFWHGQENMTSILGRDWNGAPL